jgi:hypothetical protein
MSVIISMAPLERGHLPDHKTEFRPLPDTFNGHQGLILAAC